MANTYTTGPVNTPNYNILVNKVYDWANRDIDALPVAIVQDALRYAADTAYRTLRVPPLEKTVRWSRTALSAATVGSQTIYQSVTPIAIPNDLIEFIHIRGTDVDGLTTRVFNEKTDIRSFWDICTDHYNYNAFWSRQGGNVYLTPAFGQAGRAFYGGGAGNEELIEMFYYGRLPALNATYDVTPLNFTNGFLTQVTDGSGTPLYFPAPDESVNVANYQRGVLTPVQPGSTNDGSLWFRSREFPNNDIHFEVTSTAYNANPSNFSQTRPAGNNNDPVSLFFPPVSVEDEFDVSDGRNGFTTTRNVLSAITSVTVDGVARTLTTNTDVGLDEYRIESGNIGQQQTIIVGGIPAFGTVEVEVTYGAAPGVPTGTASGTQDAQNTLTAFPFFGLQDFSQIISMQTTEGGTLSVNAAMDDPGDFDTEVFFQQGTGSIPDCPDRYSSGYPTYHRYICNLQLHRH